MRMKIASELVLMMMVTIIASWLVADGSPPQPPVAKKIPKTTRIHDETCVDDYFWLREKDNPAVIEYLKAENAYADAKMEPTKGFRQALYKEMLARIKESDV